MVLRSTCSRALYPLPEQVGIGTLANQADLKRCGCAASVAGGLNGLLLPALPSRAKQVPPPRRREVGAILAGDYAFA